MSDINNLATYFFLFISLNFEIFILITYFENRKEIKAEKRAQANVKLKKYPSVTIIVPCWNEQNTVSKTIHSLLNLDYPKDKLKIMVVDDGSTDRTWSVVQKFAGNSQIELYTKENGGKFTALNYGISKLTTDLVGCLDADSYVHKDSMKKIALYFEDKETMAVAPSIKLWQPRNVLQLLQKVEYGFGIFTRKMYHYMNAIYITPGPFSIFRREVFEKLGGYEHAHNTEDIQIALRMQKNGFKIAHAHDAVVYTVPPETIKKLLKQRVRWSYGFIKNAYDFRDMIFNKKYGNVGVLILPMACISIVSVLFVSGVSILSLIDTFVNWIVKVQTVGINPNFSLPNFEWFYVNTELIALVGTVVAVGSITMILMSKRMSEDKFDIGMDLIYYLSLYMFIAPLWIGKAAWNAIFSVKTTWR
ncbi:MAG: biofilm PGA synthesis N-glycosyltransferase PgaC [Parcubacteria bacterium C7867-003]|nr:MAG: biofilm PGA synthesis N-glycosyltransferase PgaC [Parcubacteria bacterium C7867-003]